MMFPCLFLLLVVDSGDCCGGVNLGCMNNRFSATLLGRAVLLL